MKLACQGKCNRTFVHTTIKPRVMLHIFMHAIEVKAKKRYKDVKWLHNDLNF